MLLCCFPSCLGRDLRSRWDTHVMGCCDQYVAKGWLAFPSSGVLSTHCLTGRNADEFQARLTTDMAKRNRVPELLQPARSTISGQTNQISSADAGSLCATQLVSRHRIWQAWGKVWKVGEIAVHLAFARSRMRPITWGCSSLNSGVPLHSPSMTVFYTFSHTHTYIYII